MKRPSKRKNSNRKKKRGLRREPRLAPPQSPRPPIQESAPPHALDSSEQMKLFARIGTDLWRLLNKLQPQVDDPAEAVEAARRRVEALSDELAKAGVEVQDHTNEPFDSGMLLSVIAFQPTPGLDCERISETIRPSIYFKGRSIQIGEVIVATPKGADVLRSSGG